MPSVDTWGVEQFTITNWSVYNQSYWVCSVCSFTYCTDNEVDFSVAFIAAQSVKQAAWYYLFDRLISFLPQNQ